MKPTQEPTVEPVDYDALITAANTALNSARAARVRADRSAHETHLASKLANRQALSNAEKVFDAEIARIDKLRKAATK